MLFIEGQAKAILHDFEEVRWTTMLWGPYNQTPGSIWWCCKLGRENDIILELNTKIEQIWRQIYVNVVKLYYAANANTTAANLDSAVKGKFLVGILSSLKYAIFLFLFIYAFIYINIIFGWPAPPLEECLHAPCKPILIPLILILVTIKFLVQKMLSKY